MPDSTPDAAEILWDTWGVPHIDAPSDPAAFRALGWAQMRAHGDLLLRLYGLARGRGAEYLGQKYLESDKYIRRMGIPGRAAVWAAAQTPEMLANLQGFVAGVNAYAEQHPDTLAAEGRQVLPVTLTDVFAHIQRVYLVYLTTLGQRPLGAPYNDILPPAGTLLPDAPAMGTGIAGSNAWAVSGARSASGRGLLLANPHLYWGDSHTFFEVHLRAPGLSLYGVAQVGWPVLRYGFNDQLGWAHTVNTLKGWDAFALVPDGDGYTLDGERMAFETHTETILVRQPDGTQREETLTIRRSEHGPVVAEQHGRPIAARCVGLEVSPIAGIFEQYWRMARARNHAEFEAALQMHQNAMFTVMYADAAGHAAHYFGGLVPVRPGGTWMDWTGTLAGDDSRLIWTCTHPWNELPRVINPPSGWLQNANNPPWLTTLPPALNPADYPAYLAPQAITPREQRSMQMLAAMDRTAIDDLLGGAADTRSETAERLLPALLEVVEQHGSDLARRAAAVLARWDRCYDAGSVGADLFARWLVLLAPDRSLANLSAEAWNPNEPLNAPRGLADPWRAVRALDLAAASLLRDAGTLERAWGEVVRFRRGEYDEPGHGHLDPFGVFRTAGFTPSDDGRFQAAFGTTYVAAVEFTDPVQAKVLLTYGNSSQPGSKHNGDQLPLYARKQMRDAWLSREEIEANLELREQV